MRRKNHLLKVTAALLSRYALACRVLACCTLTCCALAGCTLAPKYTPPQVTVGTHFRAEALNTSTSNTAPNLNNSTSPTHVKLYSSPIPTALNQAWWQIYQNPALNILQEEAQHNNPSLAVAASRYQASLAVLNQAQAALGPTLNTNLGANRARNSTGNNSVIINRNPPTNVFNANLQAAWEADLWGKLSSEQAAAKALAQASQGALAAAQLSLQATLAQTHFAWCAAQAKTQSLQIATVAAQRLVRLTQNRVDTGVASTLELAQANTQLHGLRAQSAQATLTQVQLENALAGLVGQIPTEFAAKFITDNQPTCTLANLPPIPPLPHTLPSELLQQRFDIHEAERQVAAANARIGVARAAFFPSLTLTANTGYRSNQWENLFNAPARFWSLGAALGTAVFDGGARQAATQETQANWEGSVANYRQVVLVAFQEVEDHLSAYQLLGQEQQAQTLALQEAQRARQLAEQQYQAGTTDALNVINAQINEWAAERNAIDLWNRRMAATVQLYKNTAGLRAM